MIQPIPLAQLALAPKHPRKADGEGRKWPSKFCAILAQAARPTRTCSSSTRAHGLLVGDNGCNQPQADGNPKSQLPLGSNSGSDASDSFLACPRARGSNLQPRDRPHRHKAACPTYCTMAPEERSIFFRVPPWKPTAQGAAPEETLE